MKKGILILIYLLLISVFTSGCMLPFFGNEAPVIQSSPPLTVTLGNTYNYQVEAIDDNDTSITYRLLLAPDGMIIDSSTGLIEWVPQESQLGANQVQVKASDGWRGTTQEFSVEVREIELSSISVLPASMEITVGQSQSVSSVTAYYDDGSNTPIPKVDCTYESSNSNMASVSTSGLVYAKIAGNITITVSFTEDEITKNDTIAVTVKNPQSSSPGGG